MARYKQIDTSPRFTAVDLERQLHPGTFEHALNYLVDHQLDLSRFDARYKNDFTGASAYPPAMLLKVVPFAYSRGIVRSRDIERACREQVTFIALSGDSAPHFTTFADFVSTLGDQIEPRVQGSPAHLRPPGAHRPRDVRHRRRQAAQQCQQGQERHPCRFPAPGRQDGSRCPRHARPPPGQRRPGCRTRPGREGSSQHRTPDAGGCANAPVAQDAPFRVEIVNSILEFFDLDDIDQVTADAFEPARSVIVESLAKEFSEALNLEISSDEMREALHRNRAEADPHICHTHVVVTGSPCLLDSSTSQSTTYFVVGQTAQLVCAMKDASFSAWCAAMRIVGVRFGVKLPLRPGDFDPDEPGQI